MSQIIPFIRQSAKCSVGCFAAQACETFKAAKGPDEIEAAKERLEHALGMGPTPCQLVDFWDEEGA